MAGFEFAVPRGYFMGPVDPPADTTGSWAAPRRPTSDLLGGSRHRGTAGGHRGRPAGGGADLVFWRAAVVVLVEHRYGGALQATVTDLLAGNRSGSAGRWSGTSATCLSPAR